jgi:outer membrane lipoprotein-sorting protein
MNAKTFFLLFLLFLFYIQPEVHAQQAETLLEKAAAAYEQSGGIEARFTADVRGETQGISESVEGTIRMEGDRFALRAADMHIWYDGATQWTYVVRTKEVNVTAPSGEELLLVHPLMLLRTYRKNCTAAYIGRSTSEQSRPADDIRLTAKGNRDPEQVDLQLDRATALPVRITVTMRNKLRSVIRISHLRTGLNPPDSLFVFPAADYPDAEIVDLR